MRCDCPDAEYIQEAERFGMPSPEEVKCPVCGRGCETIFKDRDGDVFGCDICIQQQDSWAWLEQEREADHPDWVDDDDK